MNLVPIPVRTSFKDDPFNWMQWFIALSNYVTNRGDIPRQSADPTTTQITPNTWQIVKNTTSGDLKLWANDNGVMKSITLT